MTERLTDEALDHGAGGCISTARFEAVRYWAGHETGDVFGRDSDYDGPTLTIEVAAAADAQAMLDAISRRATPADDLRAENERLRVILEVIAEQAEKPVYRSLEVGFRHSALSPAERTERLVETCQAIAQDARAALRDAQGGAD